MARLTVLKESIRNTLNVNVQARDSVPLLYLAVLFEMDPQARVLSAHELLWGMHENRYPSMESVGRLSRMVQEANPSLRGRFWDDRHKLAEEVADEITGRDKQPELPLFQMGA